jgi:serine/threonine protein kinase
MAKLKPNLVSSVNNERFLREARTLACLEHANIVPIHEINYGEDGNLFFTMKLLSGETLASILKKIEKGEDDYVKKYPQRKLLEVFIQVCETISYAHSKNIVHLDIKPENIQISDFGEVSIIDWGMAKNISEKDESSYENSDLPSFVPITSTLTRVGNINGTPGYMSPEQSGQDSDHFKIEKPSDIYSLGATLYSILYHKHPYHGLTIDQVIKNTKDGVMHEFPKSINGKIVPSALCAVAKKAMMQKPQERYAHVHELKHDVELHMHDFSTHAEDISISRILFLFLKRHYIGSIVTVAVTLLLTLISYFSINAINQKEEKLNATADEVLFGTIKKENELRVAGKYDEAIINYEKLLNFGYDYPTFKFSLADLYAGELELEKSLKYLDDISNSKAEIQDTNEFKALRNSVMRFHKLGLSPSNYKDAAYFAKELNERTAYHVFSTINRNTKVPAIERMNNLKHNIQIMNPQVKTDINFKYKLQNDNITLDLSNNPTLNNKSALIGLTIYELDISNTNIGISRFFEYTAIHDNLRILSYSNFKDFFNQAYLEKSKVFKLIMKNSKYAATNIKSMPELKYLDVEGSDFFGRLWYASNNLEYLNIAFSNFNDFDSLPKFTGLKTLVIDASMKISGDILNELKIKNTEIIIKEKRDQD